MPTPTTNPNPNPTTVATSTSITPKEEFTNDQVVTVLHGWGRVPRTEHHYIDNILFEGGVARNVPYSIAKHWKAGTRPDGKPAYGRVTVQILQNEATEADFVKATGIQPLRTQELVNMFLASDIHEIVKVLGSKKAFELAQTLSQVAKDSLPNK